MNRCGCLSLLPSRPSNYLWHWPTVTSQDRPANFMLTLTLRGLRQWLRPLLASAPGLLREHRVVPQRMLWGVSPLPPPPPAPSRPSPPPLLLPALPPRMLRPPQPLLLAPHPSKLSIPADAASAPCGLRLRERRRHLQRALPARNSSSSKLSLPPPLSLSLVNWRPRQRTELCAILPMARRPNVVVRPVRCGS